MYEKPKEKEIPWIRDVDTSILQELREESVYTYISFRLSGAKERVLLDCLGGRYISKNPISKVVLA